MKVVSTSFCLITTLLKHDLIHLYQLLQLKKFIWFNLDTPALLMRNFIWLFFFRFCALVLRNWGFNRQRLKVFKFPLSLNSQKRPGYKENTTKYRSLSWKPQSHVKILICWTWPIIDASGMRYSAVYITKRKYPVSCISNAQYAFFLVSIPSSVNACGSKW